MVIGSSQTSKPKVVAIVSKPGKPELADIVPSLLKWLLGRQYRVIVDRETVPFAPGIDVVGRDEMGSHPLSFVIVLGGDGTLLSAARAVAKAGIPVLGVNLGSLGFLTEVPVDELFVRLQSIEDGNCEIEDRSMVH